MSSPPEPVAPVIEVGVLGTLCSPAISCDGVVPDIRKVAAYIAAGLVRDGRIRYVDGRICVAVDVGRYRVANDDDTRPLCRDLLAGVVEKLRAAGDVEGGLWVTGMNSKGEPVQRENSEYVSRLVSWSGLSARFVAEMWQAVEDAVAVLDADVRVTEGIPLLNGVWDVVFGTFRPYVREDTFLTWLPVGWHGRGPAEWKTGWLVRLYDTMFESQAGAVLQILSEAMQLRSKEVGLLLLGAPGVGKSSLVVMLRWIFGMKGFSGGERGSAISDMGMLFKGKDVHPTNSGAFDEASAMFIDDLGDKFYFRDAMTRYISTGGQRLPYRQMGKDFGRRGSVAVQATLIMQSNTPGGLTGSAESGSADAIPDDRRVFVAYANHPGDEMMRALHSFNNGLMEGDVAMEQEVDALIGELLHRATLEPFRPSDADRARAIDVIATLETDKLSPGSVAAVGLVRTGRPEDVVLLSSIRRNSGRRGGNGASEHAYVMAHGLPADIVKAVVSGELRKRCAHAYQTLFTGWSCTAPGTMLTADEQDEWRPR